MLPVQERASPVRQLQDACVPRKPPYFDDSAILLDNYTELPHRQAVPIEPLFN